MEINNILVGAGGALLGLIVSKVLNKTATSIEDLPKLYWRVEELEKKAEEIKDIQALWRELGKAKQWIDDTAETSEENAINIPRAPRWGKEP